MRPVSPTLLPGAASHIRRKPCNTKYRYRRHQRQTSPACQCHNLSRSAAYRRFRPYRHGRQQSHDENNSLKFLAEGLAQKGIASLRFDKRGIAGSAAAGKEESKLRFEDYVNDVTDWIDFLAKDKRFTGITVAGHSEGSLIGMLACQSRPKVKSFISIAGAGSPAYEIIEKQVAAQMMPESIRKEVADINRSLRNGKEVAQVPAYLQALFRPSVQPYLISWYKYNPQTVIASLKMPVLILQGKNDIQVKEEDAMLLKKSSPKAELVLIDKMNHVLKDCESTAPQQQMAVYNNPSLPVNAALMNATVRFVNNSK